MQFNLSEGTGPIYMRLARAIAQQIESGALMPGDKLPPVRELSESLAISSGTIRHAYNHLMQDGWLSMAQGKGTFVAAVHTGTNTSRKTHAMNSITHLLAELSGLGFSAREIEMYFRLKLKELEPEPLLTPVAVVESSEEILSSMAEQLAVMSGVELSEYRLSDIPSTPMDAFRQCKLIITTSTNYHELCAMLPNDAPRIERVVLAPRQQSMIAVARIAAGSTIGIFCRSHRFAEVTRGAVRLCPHLRSARITECVGENHPSLSEFVKELDVLLVAPDYLSMTDAAEQDALRTFAEDGGLVIPYHHQIDEGSYMHIEQRLLVEREQ